MLVDARVRKDIEQMRSRLDSQGKLLSKQQVTHYCSVFRDRFGPDRLSRVNGEELLELIHNHSKKNSLVYWLEFKNDDEFPAAFGSIAGGSALKFIIYRRKETGVWMTGHPTKQKELTVEEAIHFAERHRDELISGAEVLEKLPSGANEEEYARMQDEMNRVAPTVSNLAWGHKYLFLLYPDKLDDYHNPDYQRYHLVKILQPPPPGDGRYVVAGRYVSVARELNVPMNNLTHVLSARDGSPHGYFVFDIDQLVPSGDPRVEMVRNNCLILGWRDLGDLSHVRYDQDSKNKLYSLIDSRHLSTMIANAVFTFVAILQERDIVVLRSEGRIFGICRITGEYSFSDSSQWPHRRPVKWLSSEKWNLPEHDGSAKRVLRRTGSYNNRVEIERHIMYPVWDPGSWDAIQEQPKPEVPQGYSAGIQDAIRRVSAILSRKLQAILYGPPGTGKTFIADIAAREIAADMNFGRGFEELGDEQKKAITGTMETSGFVRMCTFHPAYGYEDFMEGYRPKTHQGQVEFELEDGVFKKLCDDAREDGEHSYFLIIDEINRGDIPRILGELLTVMEKDKRGKLVVLPLSRDSFCVPGNVYVIGTMNTADRSIALLDTALRRRFGFIELMPDYSVLGDAAIEDIPLGPWLEALNAAVRNHVGRDARNLQIGHAYLLDAGAPVAAYSRFVELLRDDIIPLLEEYCYEDYGSLAKILGKGLVDVQNQCLRRELFDVLQKDQLVEALLQPFPDLATEYHVATIAAREVEEEGDAVEE